MKTFNFLAKQGQHNLIASLLTEAFGKPNLSAYNGPRGEGVMITLVLPPNVSKRTVDRFLHSEAVSGSVSRRNRFQVIRENGWLDLYSVADRIGVLTPFKLVRNRKMRTVMVEYYDFGCTCCGGYYRLVDPSGKEL